MSYCKLFMSYCTCILQLHRLLIIVNDAICFRATPILFMSDMPNASFTGHLMRHTFQWSEALLGWYLAHQTFLMRRAYRNMLPLWQMSYVFFRRSSSSRKAIKLQPRLSKTSRKDKQASSLVLNRLQEARSASEASFPFLE